MDKELSKKTLEYLYIMRLVNPTLYKKMLLKLDISDEELHLVAMDIPEEKRKVYSSKNIESEKENIGYDKKWKEIHYLAGRPYMGKGNQSAKSNDIPTETKSNTKTKSSNGMKKNVKNSKKKRTKTVSVYIDAENISSNHAFKIIEKASEKGKIKDKKYYCLKNDKHTASWEDYEKKLGIEAILIHGEPEKDKIDNEIKEDIRESLDDGTAAHIIIIATSDGGYIDVVKEIQDSNRDAIIAGKEDTSAELIKEATDFIPLI